MTYASVFGRPFIKRFALCYQTVVVSVCPGCLSVTFVHCGQTVGRIKMKLGMRVDLSHGLHCVRWAPSSLSPNGHSPLTQFSAPICCGHMAAWIKMSLGMELGLGPGDFVLDGDPAPLPKRGSSGRPNFRPMFIVAIRLDG